MDEDKEVMITTVDNPFSPFTQFKSWYTYDVQKGYGTCSYLARLAKTSEAFGDEMNNSLIEEAIDTMIENDFIGMYIKVYEDTPINPRPIGESITVEEET